MKLLPQVSETFDLRLIATNPIITNPSTSNFPASSIQSWWYTLKLVGAFSLSRNPKDEEWKTLNLCLIKVFLDSPYFRVYLKNSGKNLFRIVWELVTSCCGSLLILKALKPWQRIRRSLKSQQKKQNAGDCWSLGPSTSAFLTKRKNVNNFAHCPTFPQQQIECWLASIEEGHHIMLWRHPVAAYTESRGIPAGQMLVYYSDPQGKFLFLLVLYCN